VNDAGDLALELGLYRDDEAVTTNGDEISLCAAAFTEALQRSAEAGFDGAMLALHGASDAVEFGRSVIVEAAIRLDLAAQEPKEWREVVVEQRRGERGDSWPLVVGTVGRRVDEVAPSGYAFHCGEEIANLGGLESSAFDAGLLEKGDGVEKSMKLKTSASGEHSAQFGGALLLLIDPGKIGAGFERENPGAAKGREGAAGDVLAKARPLQGSSARFAQLGGDDRQ